MCSITPVSPFWFPALQKKPEEINRRSADMWSFAILLWELVTREVPFADLSNMEIGMKVCRAVFCLLTFNNHRIESIHPVLYCITERLSVSVLALRLPWRVWGPLSPLAYRPTFANSWRYAWMKTQQRGLNLTWLCQFWKKCRTNEPPVPSCPETDILPQMVVWCLPVLP